MADRDTHALHVIKEVSRTADRLAQRMGGQYVLNRDLRQALDEGRSLPLPVVRAVRD